MCSPRSGDSDGKIYTYILKRRSFWPPLRSELRVCAAVHATAVGPAVGSNGGRLQGGTVASALDLPGTRSAEPKFLHKAIYINLRGLVSAGVPYADELVRIPGFHRP